MFVMLLSVLVALNLGRPLVPWTIVEVNGEDQTFLTLFEKLQAGYFDAVEVCDDLKRAVLLQTFVGAKMETLMVASSGQSVLRVCAQFGNYVKSVELPELKDLSCDRMQSSYLIIILAVVIITARPHTLDRLLWTGNKHFITSGLSLEQGKLLMFE